MLIHDRTQKLKRSGSFVAGIIASMFRSFSSLLGSAILIVLSTGRIQCKDATQDKIGKTI